VALDTRRAAVGLLLVGQTLATARVTLAQAPACPDLLLHLGDVYPNGTSADDRQRYAPLYGPVLHGRRSGPDVMSGPAAGKATIATSRA